MEGFENIFLKLKEEEEKLNEPLSNYSLNKMIFEDRMFDNISNYYKHEFFDDKSYMPYFKLHSFDQDDYLKEFRNEPPFIYCCPLPNGERNIFQLSKVSRMNINRLTSLSLVLNIRLGEDNNYKLQTLSCFDGFGKYKKMIEFLLKDVIKYFENGVGWKDEEGNNISNKENINKCINEGFDPAL